MRRLKNLLFCLPFILLPYLIDAQDSPPINVYLPEEYGGDSQNWSISQSSNRIVYVANNRGLLEFDGAKWRMNKSPNETIIRTVKVIDSLVYTGSYHEFGYWQRDVFGVLNYTSLSAQLKVEFLENEEFWNILDYENSILFQSLDRIHIYNSKTKAYTVIHPDESILRLFRADDMFYFQTLNGGLYRIESGKQVLVSNSEIILNNLVVNVFQHEGHLLVLTQDNGFYKVINDDIEPWEISSRTILTNVSVFSAIQLQDNSFALGTISDGIVFLTKDGDLNYIVRQSNGLSNNTVLSLYEDLDRNIWLGLDNGINCINIKSPYRIYVDKNGIIGSVYTSLIRDSVLYLGTNQGLFYRKLESDEPFKFIDGTQGQVWFLDYIDDTIFCGHNSGTFIINKDRAIKVSSIQGTWQIKQIEGKDNLLLQGNYDGLYVLEKSQKGWRFRNKLEGFNISSRYFEFINSQEVLINHEYKGVFKLKIDDKLSEVERFFKDTLVKKGLYSSLVKHNNELLYANQKGIYKYNQVSNKFENDVLLSSIIDKDNFTSAKLVSTAETNKLWSFSSRGINYVSAAKLSDEKKTHSITFPVDIRNDLTGFESVTHIEDEKYLLGSTSGYVVFDLDHILNKDHNVSINRIMVSESKNNEEHMLVNLTEDGVFENSNNNIKFSYNISEFQKTQKPEYQYKLEGIYDSWSNWSTNSTVIFENLPYGNYNFVVKGRVGDQETLNSQTYSFKINRPWSLSNLSIAIYALIVLLAVIIIHNIYKTYYKKQRERFMLKTNRELELKELENKQQLMRFRNEKLREDIENKNRELGISTMNLIKKNEFLNSIKTELQNIDGSRDLKKVVKIIDRNINNNDDWNLFQEAFNNADKDFLKKIKEIHPNLTSNDLRLCAYLRLNLSSKEIAPLLNISPRSVEVKRYRLRKKMELPHEASLSDYILEI